MYPGKLCNKFHYYYSSECAIYHCYEGLIRESKKIMLRLYIGDCCFNFYYINEFLELILKYYASEIPAFNWNVPLWRDTLDKIYSRLNSFTDEERISYSQQFVEIYNRFVAIGHDEAIQKLYHWAIFLTSSSEDLSKLHMPFEISSYLTSAFIDSFLYAIATNDAGKIEYFCSKFTDQKEKRKAIRNLAFTEFPRDLTLQTAQWLCSIAPMTILKCAKNTELTPQTFTFFRQKLTEEDLISFIKHIFKRREVSLEIVKLLVENDASLIKKIPRRIRCYKLSFQTFHYLRSKNLLDEFNIEQGCPITFAHMKLYYPSNETKPIYYQPWDFRDRHILDSLKKTIFNTDCHLVIEFAIEKGMYKVCEFIIDNMIKREKPKAPKKYVYMKTCIQKATAEELSESQPNSPLKMALLILDQHMRKIYGRWLVTVKTSYLSRLRYREGIHYILRVLGKSIVVDKTVRACKILDEHYAPKIAS